ncbi:hypothetical protein ACJEDN_27250 [Klebsiella pneumoniae]
MSEVKVNGSACCDQFHGRAALTVPAIKLPALCSVATPFRARALRRCGGCLLLSPVPTYHPFESIRPGLVDKHNPSCASR